MKRETKIFVIGLLGAGLLYLPALFLVAPLPDQMLPPDKEAIRPENGMLPFAMLWFGIFGGGLISWLFNRAKIQSLGQLVLNGLIGGLIGAVGLMLALPVLARGWEGFLLWFNPGLWLIGLVLAVWGGLSGAILSFLTPLFTIEKSKN
jgi:small-conductance mechanosensitive channel